MGGILDGKIAIITGAGSGIGRATAKIFAREGARLLIADIVAEAGLETLKTLKDAGRPRSSSRLADRARQAWLRGLGHGADGIRWRPDRRRSRARAVLEFIESLRV